MTTLLTSSLQCCLRPAALLIYDQLRISKHLPLARIHLGSRTFTTYWQIYLCGHWRRARWWMMAKIKKNKRFKNARRHRLLLLFPPSETLPLSSPPDPTIFLSSSICKQGPLLPGWRWRWRRRPLAVMAGAPEGAKTVPKEWEAGIPQSEPVWLRDLPAKHSAFFAGKVPFEIQLQLRWRAEGDKG